MFVKSKDVIGLKVVTLRRGREIDNVQDLIYDPEKNRVVALLVDKGGWFSDAKVILIENVKSIGKDAVVVESSDVLSNASDVEKRIQKITKGDTYLTKTKVMTEDGNDLGKISDIYFDESTGEVAEFEVSQGGFKNMQSGKKTVRLRDIVTVGKDVTIVKSYTEQDFKDQGNDQGMQGTLKQGKGAVGDIAEKAKELAKQGKEKASDLFEEGKVLASDLSDQAQVAAYQAKHKAKDVMEKGKNKGEQMAIKRRLQAQSTVESVQTKASELADQGKSKFQEMKHNPNNQEKVESLRQKVGSIAEGAKEKFTQVKEEIKSKKEQIETDSYDQQRNEAVGRFLTKTILAPDDTTIGREGEMITNEMLSDAEQYGLEVDILENYSKEPAMAQVDSGRPSKSSQTIVI